MGNFLIAGSYNSVMTRILDTTAGRIMLLRKEAGLSQTDLATQLGVVPSTVSFWESGRRGMSTDVLAKMADVLNTSADYLLLRTDDPSPLGGGEGGADHYMAPEADAVAQIVDGLPQAKRSEILAIVRVIANEYAAQQASTDEAAEQLRTALLQVRKFTPSIYNDVLRIMRDAGVVSS